MTTTRHIVRITTMNVPEPPPPFCRATIKSGPWRMDAALPFRFEDLMPDEPPPPDARP